MKLIWIALAVAVGPATFAQQKLPLRITVETKTESSQNVLQRPKATQSGNVITHTPRVTQTTQLVTLIVKIMNMGMTEAKGLDVRYVVFGQERGSDRLQLMKQGQQTLDFKSLQTQTFQTEPVEFQKSDAKFVTGHFSELNQREGVEYRGIAIGVYSGTNQVAVAYDPQSLDQSIRRLNIPDIFHYTPPAPERPRKKKPARE
jgi:hypothetical protein